MPGTSLGAVDKEVDHTNQSVCPAGVDMLVEEADGKEDTCKEDTHSRQLHVLRRENKIGKMDRKQQGRVETSCLHISLTVPERNLTLDNRPNVSISSSRKPLPTTLAHVSVCSQPLSTSVCPRFVISVNTVDTVGWTTARCGAVLGAVGC